MQPSFGRRQRRNLWDRIWRDRHGEVVIFQWPNYWLMGWAIVTVLSLMTTGTQSHVLSWIGIGLLAIWCLLEIARGVNYFRRIFGFIILLFVIASVIRGL